MINQLNIVGTVNAAVTLNGFLYIAGSFSSVNGQARSNFAEINLTTGNLTNLFLPFDGPIQQMAACGDYIVMAGQFVSIGSGYVPYIFALYQPNYSGYSVIQNLGLDSFGQLAPYSFPNFASVKYHANSGYVYISGNFICSSGNNIIVGMLIFNPVTVQMASYNAVIQNNTQYGFGPIDINQASNVLYFTENFASEVGSYDITNPNSIVIGPFQPSTIGLNLRNSLANIYYANGQVFIANGGPLNGAGSIQFNSGPQIGLAAFTTTGTWTGQNWQNIMDAFPGNTSTNGIIFANNRYYVFGNFTHMPITSNGDISSPRPSLYIADTSLHSNGEYIAFNGPQVIQYVQNFLTIEPANITCAILDGSELHLFGNIPWVDGTPCGGHYIMNADGSRIQQRILLGQ